MKRVRLKIGKGLEIDGRQGVVFSADKNGVQFVVGAQTPEDLEQIWDWLQMTEPVKREFFKEMDMLPKGVLS